VWVCCFLFSKKQVWLLAKFFADLATERAYSVAHGSEITACAAVALARRLVGIPEAWPRQVIFFYRTQFISSRSRFFFYRTQFISSIQMMRWGGFFVGGWKGGNGEGGRGGGGFRV